MPQCPMAGDANALPEVARIIIHNEKTSIYSRWEQIVYAKFQPAKVNIFLKFY